MFDGCIQVRTGKALVHGMMLLTKNVEPQMPPLPTAPARPARHPVSPFPITFMRNQPRVQPKTKAKADETPAEKRAREKVNEGANFFPTRNPLVGKFHYHSMTYGQGQVLDFLPITSYHIFIFSLTICSDISFALDT